MASCQVSRETSPIAPASPRDAAADVLPDVLPDVRESIERVRRFVDPLLERCVAGSADSSTRLQAALRYALLAPGKRLRPALVLWSAQACGGDWDTAAPAAAAVEMIHAYSLVHDDLPAMDDDDLRRGIPTCHRAFDDATAILCGDALQALAFETLAAGLPAAAAARGCLVLARAAGADALVGGQADDLAVERGWATDILSADAARQVAWMERVHRRKTGALILASLELGGLAAGADAERLRLLATYGRAFGLAFQIADDMLDAEGTEAAVGKRVGKDAGRGKLTYPTVLGGTESRRLAEELADEAAATVAGLGPAAAELVALARWVVARDH